MIPDKERLAAGCWVQVLVLRLADWRVAGTVHWQAAWSGARSAQ
jgi:hypothetical protein